MTEHDVLVGYRVRLFTLAEELGNVSRACRLMGVHRVEELRGLCADGLADCAQPFREPELRPVVPLPLVEANYGLFSASANGGGVAFFAHIGGFLFGVVVARAFLASR